MGRANRYLLPGQISHLTHRCHNREFLLRFARDRNAYLFWLREGLRRYPVTLLGYCITCNHVHLIVHGGATEAVSELMGLLEGQVGQRYNRRKGREGGFWSDRFHGTMIDRGEYLWNCLTYVDLNMVRTGVVPDPGQWRWCGYAELVGTGRKVPLVNWERLAELLGCSGVEQLRQRWRQQIAFRLQQVTQRREPCWTEAVAVGRREYVDWVSNAVAGRQRWDIQSEANRGGLEFWTIRETAAEYRGSKNHPGIATNWPVLVKNSCANRS